MKNNLLLLLLFISGLTYSQNKQIPSQNHSITPTGPKKISADCKTAVQLNLQNITSYGPTVAPNGFGNEQEIKTLRKNVFEEEHNSAWYLLSVGRDGELIFEITPLDTLNDYDFLVYTYTDTNFCPDFESGKLKPLRNNLSNIKRSVLGVTGLKMNAPALSIGKGVGDAYSKSLPVKMGEKYMLVLDNVHPDGKGHTITFNYMKDVLLKGKVIGSDSLPIALADITLSDYKGNAVLEAKTDKNGEYAIKTTLIENKNYSMSIISENTFVDIRSVNTKTWLDKNDIRVLLPQLKKGEKYKLGNINFYGDMATLLPESLPSVEALYKLMKKNKKMVIQIEGHTNGEDWHLVSSMQSEKEKKLSQDRAKVIYFDLAKKGIDKNRMSTVGYGSTQILFKNATKEEQQSANRRVEIKVISLE